ncbi:hypothetical protein [Priestia aryabhattai]|uniref:Uncharacterized protein n=1 Tax=Priestia aryabhattai TaxID=412384 RepID=A0ABD7X4B4_PRIAR|nr:hypothetical protein [Priestia aryabhattai]WEA47314.1 hypothetical protein PWO00_28475 [Priestia aryabhattai]
MIIKEFLSLCRVVSVGHVRQTKFGERCEVIVDVMKTTYPAFEKAHRIKVIAWKDKAKQAATFHNNQVYVFFFTNHKRDVDWLNNPIQAITALKIFKATKREIDMYYINSQGQYDPFSKLIV